MAKISRFEFLNHIKKHNLSPASDANKKSVHDSLTRIGFFKGKRTISDSVKVHRLFLGEIDGKKRGKLNFLDPALQLQNSTVALKGSDAVSVYNDALKNNEVTPNLLFVITVDPRILPDIKDLVPNNIGKSFRASLLVKANVRQSVGAGVGEINVLGLFEGGKVKPAINLEVQNGHYEATHEDYRAKLNDFIKKLIEPTVEDKKSKVPAATRWVPNKEPYSLAERKAYGKSFSKRDKDEYKERKGWERRWGF